MRKSGLPKLPLIFDQAITELGFQFDRIRCASLGYGAVGRKFKHPTKGEDAFRLLKCHSQAGYIINLQ